MSTFTLLLEVGDVTRVVTVMEARLDDPTDLMKDILLLAIRSTQLNFEAQGRPQRWDDLAESTIRRRFARAAGSRGGRAMGSLGALGSIRILIDTGLLLQSVGGGANGPFSAGGGQGESDRFSATITTSNPGSWNQLPDTLGRRPIREFMLWQSEDDEDALGMTADFVLGLNAYAVA